MTIRYLFIISTLLFLSAATSRSERELPRRSKDFALFIAVNDYQYWGKLRHPISEVEKIAAELYQHYEFDTLILRNPTQEQIVTALRSYNARPYPDDGQLLIYLSGHGSFDDLTKEGFFIPREGRLNDVAQTSYLSFSRMRDLVGNISCNHILLAIDACYSGTFDRLVASRGELSFGRPGATANDERSRFITRELTLRSRIFIASGKKEQTPDASNFAAYFLKALRSGGSDDAIVSIQELEAELIKAQPKPHISVFGDHQRESNFLFIKNQSAPVAPTAVHNARQDLADWQEAQRLNTAAAYRAYLSKQARGDFRTLAEQKAQDLEAEAREIAAWNDAKNRNTCDAYKNFLRDYPQSAYRPLAEEGKKKVCTAEAPSGMVFVRGGTFDRGDVMSDNEKSDEPVYRVTVADFYFGRYEVTFAEYDRYCDDTGRDKPSDWGWGRGNRPVINVSWYDVVEYSNWLSAQHGLTPYYTIDKNRKAPNNNSSLDDLKWTVTLNRSANGYRLPTEAEWEYAAREGGKKVRFGNGKDIINPKEINFNASASYKKPYSLTGKYRQKTVPVGSLNSPNALGLHDMSGNVWEWCWDWYGSYPTGAQNNPMGADKSTTRVCRGGSWLDYPQRCRAAYRLDEVPSSPSPGLGLRLARSSPRVIND